MKSLIIAFWGLIVANRLKQIRALPCCQCGAPPPSQAAHANWQEFGKGKGIKAKDDYTIPLCHLCHSRLDQYQGLSRQEAKSWFISKLKFINQVLDNETSF